MIFVTVGTHYMGFERLIEKMDEIAPNLDDEVIMQIGTTKYEPKNAKWYKFIEMEKIQEYYKKADIIVAHSGAGTLLDSLSFEKPVITVPRLKKFGEHIDDQQIELAEALDKTNRTIAIYSIENLERSIIKVKDYKFELYPNSEDLKSFLKYNLIGTIK